MRKTDKIIALAATLLFHAAVLIAFLFSYLRFPPEGMEWPPQPEHEIVLEEVEDIFATGEFVRRGDILDPTVTPDQPAPSNEANPEPTQDAVDPVNAGKPAEPQKVTTSEQPSPAKVQKKQNGPTKEEIAAEKARQEAKRQQQTKKNVDDATRKAFGGGKGNGTAGSAEGNSSTGAIAGTPGNGLKGRSLESWSSVQSTKLGEIAIRVRVNSQGQVVDAQYVAARSSGTVAADASMRQACIARSRQCRFSVLEGSPEQSGIITWVFK